MAYPDTKKCTFYKLKDREKRKIEQKQTEAVKNLVFDVLETSVQLTGSIVAAMRRL